MIFTLYTYTLHFKLPHLWSETVKYRKSYFTKFINYFRYVQVNQCEALKSDIIVTSMSLQWGDILFKMQLIN